MKEVEARRIFIKALKMCLGEDSMVLSMNDKYNLAIPDVMVIASKGVVAFFELKMQAEQIIFQPGQIEFLRNAQKNGTSAEVVILPGNENGIKLAAKNVTMALRRIPHSSVSGNFRLLDCIFDITKE